MMLLRFLKGLVYTMPLSLLVLAGNLHSALPPAVPSTTSLARSSLSPTTRYVPSLRLSPLTDVKELALLRDLANGREFWLGSRYSTSKRAWEWVTGDMEGETVSEMVAPESFELLTVPDNQDDSCLFANADTEGWSVTTCGEAFPAYSDTRLPFIIKYLERESKLPSPVCTAS